MIPVYLCMSEDLWEFWKIKLNQMGVWGNHFCVRMHLSEFVCSPSRFSFQYYTVSIDNLELEPNTTVLGE